MTGKILGLTITLCATGWTLFACSSEVDCYNAFDALPARLLADNEYVFVGVLQSEDTLRYLGRIQTVDDSLDWYLMQYTFTPVEVFVSNSAAPDSLVQLWHVATRNLVNDWWGGLPCTQKGIVSTIERHIPESHDLVYGNSISEPGEIPKAMMEWLPDGEADYGHLAANELSECDFPVDDSDTLVFHWLNADSSLAATLDSSKAIGPVIYGTDFTYRTHRSFHDGRLACCDSTTFTARVYSCPDYLSALRDTRSKQ